MEAQSPNYGVNMQNLTQFAQAIFDPNLVVDLDDDDQAIEAQNQPIVVALKLADIVADAAMAQAEQIACVVALVRGAVDPKAMMDKACKDFADALEAKGYKGAPQRKSDLKAILKAAIAHPDYVVDGPGLQGMAKHARGFGKTPKAATVEQDDEVAQFGSVNLLLELDVLIIRALDHGKQDLADDLRQVFRKHFD